MNLDQLRLLLAPIRRSVRLLVGRGTVSSSDDSGGVQVLKLSGLDDEVLAAVTRVQQFGLSSRPPKGSTAVFVCVGGSRGYPVAIAVDAPGVRQVNLNEGESALQNAFGDYVWIKADGTMYVKASGTVTVDAPLVHALHDMTVDGNLVVNGTSHLVGNVQVDANLNVAGNTTGTGTLHTDGSISSGDQVSDSGGTLNNVRAAHNEHGHPNIQHGSTLSDPPNVTA